MTFTLTIELGNDAMQTAEDIANALRAYASKFDREGMGGRSRSLINRVDGGKIMDANGNSVGTWEVK